MSDNKTRPIWVRILGSISSIALIISVIYIFFAGVSFASGIIIVSALAGLAGPVISTGTGFIECMTGTLEAFVEGIQAIFEAIAGLFSSL